MNYETILSVTEDLQKIFVLKKSTNIDIDNVVLKTNSKNWFQLSNLVIKNYNITFY